MKTIYIIPLIFLILLSGCEDFLDTTDYTNKNDGNFPINQEDAEMLLTGCYAMMARLGGKSSFFVMDVISDDRFSGGGTGDTHIQAVDKMLKANDNMMSGIWEVMYKLVYNTNKLIEAMENITDFDSENSKNTILGEAYFLRAMAYAELTRFFGDIPLYPDSHVENIERTPADQVYALIAHDFKKAIELLPSISFPETPTSRLGHATKWAAEAFLAKVFLFYTGYYNKTTLPLYEGGSITEQEVIDYLEDCINNSGHGLLNDFRSLWCYGNAATRNDYPYTRDNNIVWIDETGDNIETVYAIKFSTTASWTYMGYENEVALYGGFRSHSNYANVFPFGQGWGQGTVNPRFAQQWKEDEPEDIRYQASILDIDDPSEGIVAFEDGAGEQMENTHLWQKKYIPVNAWRDKEAGRVWGFACELYGMAANYAMQNTQDLVLMRFSNVLLMYAELTKTKEGINQVRERVGLKPIAAYSHEALEKERHYELAFEGERYFDLLRWYGPEEAGRIIDKNQNGVEVLNNKVPAVINNNLTKRMAETKGLMQIPQTQIDLSDGKLTQNPGWTGADIIYNN